MENSFQISYPCLRTIELLLSFSKGGMFCKGKGCQRWSKVDKVGRAFPFNKIRNVPFESFLMARRLRRLFEDDDVDIFVSFCLVKNGSLISVNHSH